MRLAPLEAVNAQKDVLIRNIQQQMNQLMSHRQCPNAASLPTQADARFNAGPLIGGSDMNLDHLERFKRNSLASPSRTRPVSASSLLRARQIHDVSNLTGTHHSFDFAPDEPINAALFERIRRERQILSGLVTQLQRDLANKDNDLGRLTQEVNALKKQLNEKDIALSASHIRKYKTAELRSQSLKEEAEKSERERSAMQKSLEESQNQLQAIRNSMNLLKSKCDELQRSERTAQLEKEEVNSQYERLRNKIMRTVFAALAKQCATSSNEIENNDGLETGNATESFVSVSEIGNTSNNAVDNEMDDNNIMDKLNVLVQDYFKLHRSLTAFTKTAKDQNQRDQILEKELNEFVALMRENQNHLSSIQHGRFSAQLRGQIDLLNAYAPKSKPIRLLQETLSQSWKGQLNNVQHIEDCIQEVSGAIASTCSDLTTSLTSHPHDTVTGIRRLAEFGMSMHAGREELQHELRQTRKNHEEEVQRIKQLHHKELQRRTEEAVNANNIENAEKLNQAISNVVRIENERQEQLIAVKQAIIEELELKLRETRQLMAERQTSHEAELHLLRNRVRETDHLERALGDKDTAYVQLSAQLESVKKAIEKTRQDTEVTCEEKWRKEVELHREQAKQHARTICVMEERLVKLAKQTKEAKAEVTRLKRQQAGDKSSSNEPNRQVANLRREVAELRSQTLLSEVLPALRATSTSRQPAIEGGSVRTETDSGLENTLMDRTGLRSAMDALHNSEECYLDLSRAIARQLDVDNLPGQRSLVHVPSPERQLIRQERAQALGLLSQRIGILREQVQRKTDLLNNYEHDMGKLRQAEAIAETKNEQMGRMLADLRSKETEIQLLRESLDRTREALANEQRTISAIRKSKHIIPTQSSMDSKGMADRKKQPHCPIADPISTDNKRIQDMCEKIKRKDYEIKMLKNELSEREKQYTETSEKLSRMQTSMGLKDS
ncbi:hypothetical protein FGIG_08048 [Fasciola gigantica]|uniref:Forkhead-associated domain-containing protein 1 n=1 Tax=Fasciola gigantica TaxID=46835 RepID=A0A504YJQ6_FASGI|nr:hypothetical protein FGIG_08048 [Fasciola gigantica]